MITVDKSTLTVGSHCKEGVPLTGSGANCNSLIGLTSLGRVGGDVSHTNLHKVSLYSMCHSQADSLRPSPSLTVAVVQVLDPSLVNPT
jgi:hypothetical protein